MDAPQQSHGSRFAGLRANLFSPFDRTRARHASGPPSAPQSRSRLRWPSSWSSSSGSSSRRIDQSDVDELLPSNTRQSQQTLADIPEEPQPVAVANQRNRRRDASRRDRRRRHATEEDIITLVLGEEYNRRQQRSTESSGSSEARDSRRSYRHRAARRKRAIRAKAILCLVSGIFLAIVLTIYLALAITNSSLGRMFQILLILVILIISILFMHSLIRLCMLFWNKVEPESRRSRMARLNDPRTYATPQRPIPVILARDEEALVSDHEEPNEKVGVRAPPPAYGNWRSTVRMNPNLMFWQQVDNAAPPERPVTGNRPPSYISDDGVSYLVEAQPRSTIAMEQRPHPSERGRMAVPPSH